MPKTPRQTFTWSSSSDDDVSIPYARPSKASLPAPKQRKQRPGNKSGRNKRIDSSSKSSRPTKRPSSLSTKTTSGKTKSKNVIVETNWSDDNSSSSEEEVQSSQALHKNRSSSQNFKKDKRRSTLDNAPPSLPTFTPIVPKNKRTSSSKSISTPKSHVRKPIRVNLTPDPCDMPEGWLTKSQLLDVASRHQGMAIQYRVMYHTSQKSIRDNNAGATRKIRYRDAVVQSRFACVSGSHGGNTYSFMRWRLPGTLHQSRNAKHVTIYKDTRPRLPFSGRKETDCPLIILCNELKDADRRIAERFLRNAEAGMTPEQFYSQKQAASDGQATNEEQGDSPLVSQDDDVDDNDLGGYVSEMENESPATKQPTATSNRTSRRELRQPLADQNSTSKSTPCSSKRGRDTENDDKAAKRTKKKGYGGARKHHRSKVEFQIDESSPQFLALVEGVAGATSGTRSSAEKADDYIRDVFMNGRVEKLPSSGRMLELPGEAMSGRWSGELVDTRGGRPTGSGRGIMRDKIENLKDIRIQLRHDGADSVGPLKLSRSSPVSSPLASSSRDILRRIRGGGSGSPMQGDTAFTVSLINPSHSRRHDVLSQGIVSKDALLDRPAFVGSISFVSFDGFSSSTDARLSSCTKSASLLESCRNHAIEAENNGMADVGFIEDILPIPSTAPSDDHNVGVSFICQVGMEDSYGLLVANDENGRIVAVDVVFDETIFESSRSSISSTSSYQHHEPSTSRLTERLLQRHAEDMELVSPSGENPSSEDTDDKNGMLLDDVSQSPMMADSPVGSPVAHKLERGTKKTDETADSFSTKASKTVTIVSTPFSEHVTHAPSDSAAAVLPKSILKKSRVTPGPRANHIETSFSDETGEHTTPDVPLVTPVPGRREQKQDFLSMLNQVADEPDSTVKGARNVEQHVEQQAWSESSSDVFEDPVNEGLEYFDELLGRNATSAPLDYPSNNIAAEASSPVSRFPSIHDVFYGGHDEEEHVEFTDFQDIAIESPTMNYFLSVLHDFFFRDAEDVVVDDDTIPSQDPKRSIRQKTVRGTFSVLLLVFVLWLSLVPTAKDVPRSSIPKRRSSSVAALPLSGEWQKQEGKNEKVEGHQVQQTWLSMLW